jgi:hypothetical protein
MAPIQFLLVILRQTPVIVHTADKAVVAQNRQSIPTYRDFMAGIEFVNRGL